MKVSQSELFMNFERFFKTCRKKTSNTMIKLTLMSTATGKEDPELPLLQRIGSLETVQRRLCESGLHGRIAAKKPLLKDTNKKKRLVWDKKHEQWTLDRWKSVESDESKFEIFGSNHCVFVRCRVGEQMISACVVSPVKHGGGGVMVL